MSEGINLSQFGWDGLIVPAELNNLCRYLPKWEHLKALRAPQVVGHHKVYFPHKYFYDISGQPYMPAIEKQEIINDNGGYSEIYRAQRCIYRPDGTLIGSVRMNRVESFKEVCIKEIPLNVTPDEGRDAYNDEIRAVMYEAYLQVLVQVTLDRAGLGRYVPHLIDVLATTISGEPIVAPWDVDTIWITMDLMEGMTLEKYLALKFRTGTKVENTQLLADIFYQLATVLDILQKKLQFNHRDLKINNVYVREASSATTRTLTLPGGLGTYTCKVDLVMIDFGFGCIACGSGFTNPRASLFGAGSYFTAADDCMKQGRDLAQFIYSLHCGFPLQNYVTKDLFDYLHAAMKAMKKGSGVREYDLFMGVDAIGTPLTSSRLPASIKYNNGIYMFLRDNAVDVPACDPLLFLRGLRALRIPEN
jgi:serine/threonine protein kinase